MKDLVLSIAILALVACTSCSSRSTTGDAHEEQDVNADLDEEMDAPLDPEEDPVDAAEEDLAHLDTDDDEDGYTELEGDCDDDDPDRNPGAREICGDGIDQNCDGEDFPCYGDPEQVGRVSDSVINECSGTAWSRTQPIIWLHNDSGDSARFYGIAEDGTLVATVSLTGATARDWEDMAIGPDHSGGFVLLFADIGDNARARDRVRVYRVAEPTIDLSSAPVTLSLDAWESFDLFYPDHAHDAETFLADPDTGDVYIVSKESDGNSGVYRAPEPADGAEVTMTLVASLAFGTGDLPGSRQATAGDISQDGLKIIIRTYNRAFIFLRFPSAPIADAFSGHVYEVPAPSEPQAEAIAFAPDGLSYTTVSEGTGPWVYRMSGS
jgi:hypothetical protein